MTRKWAQILVENIIYQIATETAWGRYDGANAIRSLVGTFIIDAAVEEKIAEQVEEIKKFMCADQKQER